VAHTTNLKEVRKDGISSDYWDAFNFHASFPTTKKTDDSAMSLKFSRDV